MDKERHVRFDLVSAFNQTRFQLRYYARGYYPVLAPAWNSMPFNRLFFPLLNPGGNGNYIEDSHGVNVLVPGNLYFVPPNLKTRWRLDPQLNFLSIHTHLEVIPGIELFSNCPKMLVIPKQKELDSLLKYLFSDPNELIMNSMKAGSLIHQMQLSLTEFYSEDDFWGPISLRKYSNLTEFLIHQGNAKTSVSDLAALCGESREVFTKHFTESTGLTPKQLIDKYVIRHCVQLLTSGYSIKETAEKLKFSNEFAFSRYFKRLMQEPPKVWKRKYQKTF